MALVFLVKNGSGFWVLGFGFSPVAAKKTAGLIEKET
jgi:hypothetical protein